MEDVKQVLELLTMIETDSSVPRNVRDKIAKTICCLKEGCDCSIDVNIDKAIQNLDELSTDPNIPTFTRTQIWSAMSALESK
jgi:uncharacterized protein